MDVRKGPWQTIQRIAIFAFVAVFLGAAVLQNASSVARRSLPLSEAAAQLLGVLGATQNWPMFGAYFPDHVRVPVVQLVLAGGRRVFLLPAASPAFEGELAATFQPNQNNDATHTVSWRGNFGAARIEKYQSRASNPAPAWLGVRTAYTANQVRKWVGTHPALASRVRRVDLLSVSIAGPREGRAARVLSTQPLEIAPDVLESWPTQQHRQLFSPAS